MGFKFFVTIGLLAHLAIANEGVIEIAKPIEFEGKTLRGAVKFSELNGLDKLNVKLGNNSVDAVLEMTAASKTKSIHNCRDYDEASKQGFRADTTYALSMESFFKSTCPLIRILKRASPATKSERVLAFDQLENLPSELIVNLEGHYRKTLKQKDIVGKSLADFAKKTGFRLLKASKDQLEFEFSGMRTKLESVARADFENSGKEQVLVFKADYATGGSYRHYEYVILTPGERIAKVRQVAD